MSDVGRSLSYPVGTSRPKRKVQDSRHRFPGFLRLQNLYDKCPSPEHEAIFLTLFHTGCRVSESIKLRRDMCAWNDDAIYVYGAQVLKHKKKATREVMIPNDPENPLYPRFLEYLERCKTVYLLPAYQKFTHSLVPDMHTTRSTVYTKLREVDPSLFPHLLRGWNAGYFVDRYGLSAFDLQQLFNWKSAETPAFYARTREKDLEKKLGIGEAPRLQ